MRRRDPPRIPSAPCVLCGCGVVIGGVLARLIGVMLGVSVVAVRDVGVVVRFLVVSGGVMLSRGAMVFRGMLVMLGGFQMVFFTFFRHGSSF
jgi:hypothetical protein